MNLSIFISPEQPSSTKTTKPPVAKANPIHEAFVEATDRRLLDALNERQGASVLLWNLINEVANYDRPRSTPERNLLRLEIWSRLKRLLHLGALKRVHRRWIRLPTVGDPMQATACSTPRKPVGRRPSRKPHHSTPWEKPTFSTSHAPKNQERIAGAHEIKDAAVQTALPSGAAAPDPPSAPAASGIELSQAARRLAGHRWQFGRRTTGSVSGRRVRLGQTIMMPDGKTGRVLFAWRGCVLLEIGDIANFEDCKLAAVSADDLRLVKNPHAALLGSCKLGRCERHSAKKVRACKKNGCVPPRPGSRPRGRPRTAQIAGR